MPRRLRRRADIGGGPPAASCVLWATRWRSFLPGSMATELHRRLSVLSQADRGTAVALTHLRKKNPADRLPRHMPRASPEEPVEGSLAVEANSLRPDRRATERAPEGYIGGLGRGLQARLFAGHLWPQSGTANRKARPLDLCCTANERSLGGDRRNLCREAWAQTTGSAVTCEIGGFLQNSGLARQELFGGSYGSAAARMKR